VKRYMAVIFVVWAFAYFLFWLGPGGHGKDEGEGNPARPAEENFDFRFIARAGKSSVNIELTEQRKVRDKETGHVSVEDMATGLYKQRKGPFPKDSEEFKIDPAYLKGMAEADLGGNFTLLTPKGQHTMIPEGLYYQSRGCGTEFVMMRLKPKKPRSFPVLQEGEGPSASSDLFVLKQPHPPVRRMEVLVPEKASVPPEMRELVKDQVSRAFRKIRGSRAYSQSRVKPDPNPTLTYLKFPSRTGLKLVAAVWSARGSKGYRASALFQIQEEKHRTNVVKVVDLDPYNESMAESKVKILLVNESMFAFVLNEGKFGSQQEKVYTIPREGGPWQLRGTSVYRSDTC